ncbi:MAG: dihydrolipoamide succinyltransferase, partial [Rhodospirillales bacterium 20-60-12]
MATEIKVPTLGESVTSATVARWMKKVGDNVAADEPIVELETDKVTVEVNAPQAGTISDILAAEGAEVEVGSILGMIGEGAAAAPKKTEEKKSAANPPAGVNAPPTPSGPVARPAASPAPAPLPAAAKKMEEQKVSASDVGAGSGKDGRITKGDVIAFLDKP